MTKRDQQTSQVRRWTPFLVVDNARRPSCADKPGSVSWRGLRRSSTVALGTGVYVRPHVVSGNPPTGGGFDRKHVLGGHPAPLVGRGTGAPNHRREPAHGAYDVTGTLDHSQHGHRCIAILTPLSRNLSFPKGNRSQIIEYMNTLGQRLHATRRLRGLSQDEVANFCGATRGAVSQWEKDETDPSGKKLVAIARNLGVTAEWLAEGDPDDTPPTDSDVIGEIGTAVQQLYSDLGLVLTTRELMAISLEIFKRLHHDLETRDEMSEAISEEIGALRRRLDKALDTKSA